jgi:prephenate dehydrogenase
MYEEDQHMKIGILGTGNIGRTLVKRLSKAGHEVKVANSRGPETIDADLLSGGARAVTSAEAVTGVDVVIMSTQFGAIPKIAPLFANAADDTVVIDTSNYYPKRDGVIAAIEGADRERVGGGTARSSDRKGLERYHIGVLRREGCTGRKTRQDRDPDRCRWRA